MHEEAVLKAVQTISKALSPLEESDRARALKAAASMYDVTIAPASPGRPGNGARAADEPLPEFAGFVDLYDAANPRTDAERAAVAAYWFQVIQGNASWQSQTLNGALKNLGYPIKNITDALTTLQSRRPSQVRQVTKAGTSKQARKTYKLTTAGENAVRAMLGRAAAPEDEE